MPLAGRDGTFQGRTYYGSYRFFSGALARRSGEYDAACVDLEASLAHHEVMAARPWIVLARRELAEVLRARNCGSDMARAQDLELGLEAMATELTMDVCCGSS